MYLWIVLISFLLFQVSIDYTAKVIDVNDNPPQYEGEPYSVTVLEVGAHGFEIYN